MHKVAKSLLVVSLLVGCIGSARAEMSREAQAIKVRQGAYSMLSWYLGSMLRMAKGDEPYNRARFTHDAEALAFLSKLPNDAFIPGSDKGDTKASPEIWKNPDAFRLASEKMETEARKLADLAVHAEPSDLGDQLKQVRQACKACHEDFKQRSN